MELNLNNKHVLITGASKGLGAAFARAFAQEGCRLSLLARNREKLQLLTNELGGQVCGHTFYASDLLAKNAPEEAMEQVTAINGTIDIVIHNLGGSLGIVDPLAPISQWLDIWRLNIGVAIELNNMILPTMMEAKWGRVVMVSSIDANNVKGAPLYGAAKAFLNSYIQHVAWRVAKHGVVLSGILPGPILAEGNSWEQRCINQPERVKSFVEDQMPMGRLGAPEDLCPFVLLMASELNQWAVGSLLQLDGGVTV